MYYVFEIMFWLYVERMPLWSKMPLWFHDDPRWPVLYIYYRWFASPSLLYREWMQHERDAVMSHEFYGYHRPAVVARQLYFFRIGIDWTQVPAYTPCDW